MEIHTPDEPITSWRSLFTHLGIVTVGILIALALEGCVQWIHHRNLANEARANITQEIRDNRAELEHSLSSLPASDKQVQNIIAQMRNIKNEHSIEIRYSFDDAHLSNASWSTAQTTGALSYMSYADVKRFSTVYDLQREYVALQNDLVQRIIDSNAQDDTMANVAPIIDRMSSVDRAMQGIAQVGRSLDDQYKKF
jgi:hypothetical protein